MFRPKPIKTKQEVGSRGGCFKDLGFQNTLSRAVANLILLASVLGASQSHAFELLSEGAMDSVSAVSVATTEELLNVAGSPAAGLSDDYESLPFEARISVADDETDEVQVELDFALTQEVEAWAQDVGVTGGRSDFNVVDELPAPVFEDNGAIGPERLDANFTVREDAEVIEELEQQGRVDSTLDFARSGVTGITVQVERFIERAETINPNVVNSSPGSGFVSNSRALGSTTLTAIRE